MSRTGQMPPTKENVPEKMIFFCFIVLPTCKPIKPICGNGSQSIKITLPQHFAGVDTPINTGSIDGNYPP